MSPNHTAAFPHGGLGKITAAGTTKFCITGVTGIAVGTMFIRTGFGARELRLIRD
jgi:hypothetical protein